jgi:hypothetical protein
MTYWRRSNYPVDGHADVPNDVWREFQRIRDGFMDIDQNNVLANGVRRARITKPNNTNREGISTTLNAAGAFAYDQDIANPVTITESSDDGVWLQDSLVTLDVYSRWDSWWMIGAGSSWQAELPGPVGSENVMVDLGVTAGSGLIPAIATGQINVTQYRCAPAMFAPAFLSAGPHTITLAHRARWDNSATFNMTYDTRNLFAFALYR